MKKTIYKFYVKKYKILWGQEGYKIPIKTLFLLLDLPGSHSNKQFDRLVFLAYENLKTKKIISPRPNAYHGG